MLNNKRGFTLVELIIAMAVFIVVIIIASNSFQVILTQAAKLTRSEESNIEGVVGMEILRHDLAQAGYGLFYEYDPAGTVPQYNEAAAVPASTLNMGTTGVPRPFSAINNLTGASNTSSGITYNMLDNSDYLAIRATSVGTEKNTQRWTFVQYSSTGKAPKRWPSAAENIEDDTWVILVRRTFTSSGYTSRLVLNPAVTSATTAANDYYSVQFSGNAPFSNAAFLPANTNEFFYVYGLFKPPGSSSAVPRMPFNRADYFVASGAVPQSCATNTGVLYKTVVNHTDGSLSYIPILDCVANMQVVFGWDLYNGAATGQDGIIDTYSNADGSTVSGTASVAEVQAALGDAARIRDTLKLVKVYVLAQVGTRDSSYTAATPIRVGELSEGAITSDYALTGNMTNYHWKLYKIVVRPKNIVSAQ